MSLKVGGYFLNPNTAISFTNMYLNVGMVYVARGVESPGYCSTVHLTEYDNGRRCQHLLCLRLPFG